MTESTTPDIARLILDQAPDAIIFAGIDGTVQEWNAAAEQIFGHSCDEAMGQSLDLIIPERFRESHWTAFDAAIAAGKTRLNGKALPTRSMRKDGTTIYVELSFGVVLDSEGTAIGALAIARDITEKFLTERAKRENAS
ncbi:MAG: PAS domain-containing protein [Dehalococcoidia bacterium]